MATVTVKVTAYSTFVLTYNVAQTDTTTTITFTNWKYTNSRSGGTTEKVDLDMSIGSGSPDQYGTQARAAYFEYFTLVSNLAAGTKTKSGTFSSMWFRYNKTHSARTDKLECEMTVNGVDDFWDKAVNVTVSIPAKTSYAVALVADGGTGGTASLKKWYNEPLNLTTGFTAPTRTGYRFEGWASSSGGTVFSIYNTNEATTLYAVWIPVITGVSLSVHTLRVADGSSTTESDDGDHCYGTVAYTVTGGAAGTLTLALSADDSTVVFDSGQNVELTKNADTTLTGTHIFRASNCDTDTNITFTVSGSATNTSVSGEAPVSESQSDILSAAYFPLDILGNAYWDSENQTGQRPGHGIAFGLPAKKEGFAVGMDIFFQQWAGVIQMFAGSTPPAGWLLCDGSAVSRTDYATLYAAIGDTWGAGDGSTTFNLPDLRGRAPIGAGTGSGLTARTLGGKGGSEDAIIPYHNHTMGAHTHAHPGDPYLGNDSTVTRSTVTQGSGTKMTNVMRSEGATGRHNNTGAMNGTPTTGYAGSNGNTDNANMQPYAVVNYIIHTGKTN